MKEISKSEFKSDLALRLKMARKAAGYTQKQFAKALGIDEPDTYAKYENRSQLPMHLLSRVCQLTGHDPWYFLTGEPSFKSGTNNEYTRTPPDDASILEGMEKDKVLELLELFKSENEFDDEQIDTAKKRISQLYESLGSSTTTVKRNTV